MSSTPPSGADRAPRQPWGDRWLLDAFRQLGHPAAERVGPAKSAWEALEAAGLPTEEIVRLVCDMSGEQAVDMPSVAPEPELAALLPVALAKRYGVVPLRLNGRALEVATSNPLEHQLERDLAFACARRIHVLVASPAAIRQAQERIYREPAAPNSGPRISWIVQQAPHSPLAAPTRGVAADTLDRIVTDAVDQRASDIHLEPKDGELVVRFRVDGVLHDISRVASDVVPLLLSRLKVIAGLDIANRLRPQDGRVSMVVDGRQIDLRISTLPLGARLEKAVIRLLDATATSLDLEVLGFTGAERQKLEKLLSTTEGMVLVTGPTGSGKTTTLYSALRHIKSRETNIVTVEDPIEYRLDGVNQVQVNERAGLTFASALRSILRQDPDVVLLGEIRDGETAGIALKASMTGHLVLATLHTTDAPSAIGRLADIGADLSTLAGALKGVIAQRLVRRLCKECSVPVAPHKLAVEQQALLEGKDTSRLRRPVGCAACRNTGYRGRMAIAEILVIDDETQQLIARSSRRLELLQLARKHGMHTLWEAGLERVLDGQTSLYELLDNVIAPIPDGDLQQEDVDRLLGELLGEPAASAPPSTPQRAVSLASAPRHESPVAQATRATPTAAREVSRVVIAPRAANAQPRVLVVHEVRDRRRQLRRALERVGCTVIEVIDGETALAYACRLRPDAIVTEIAVPRLDGIALMQGVLTEQIVDRVFIYTDQRDELLLEWARSVGACDVLTTADDVETIATRLRAEFPAADVVDISAASGAALKQPA